jgi:hypothetical protein
LVRFLLILFVTSLLASCAQHGCPGGMCPPDRYFAPYKKAGKRGMTSTSQSIRNNRSSNKGRNSGKDWSRSSSRSIFSFRRNFESDKFAGSKEGPSSFRKSFESDQYTTGKSNKKSSFKNNFESDKYAGSKDGANSNKSLIEKKSFNEKRSSRKYNFSRLLGAKKIRNRHHKGHEEGLFSSNVSNFWERKSYHVKHRKSKGKIGVKKLH